MTTYLGTRLGTRLGSRLGTFSAGVRELMYALRDWSAANYYATTNPGGEEGVSTGFGGATLLQLVTIPPSGFYFFQGRQIGGAGNSGWQQLSLSTGLTAGFGNAVGGFTYTPTRALTASDVGRIFLLVSQHTGAGGQARSYVDRDERSAAINGYTPSAAAHSIGTRASDLAGSSPTRILATATWRGVPTLAHVQAYMDAARALGDLPDTMQGATITHRWSARDELRGKALTAPAQLTDTVTKAPADAMARTGTPTAITIDTTRDGRRLLGAQGFSAANYLQTADSKGLRGAAGGFWLGFPLRVDQQSGLDASFRLPISCGTAWDVRTQSTNSSLYFALSGATAGSAGASGVYTIAASDVNQVVPVLCVYDGGSRVPSLYVRGALIGTGTALAATYANAQTAPMIVGKRGDGFASDGISLFGLAGGDGFVPTAGEVAEWFAAWDRTGRVPAIAGKTTYRADFTDDILAAGETVPSIVLDRVGTDHLSHVQSVSSDGKRVGPFSTSLYYQSAEGGGIAGSTSGFWVFAVPRFWRVPTLTEQMVSHGMSTTANWGIQCSGATLRCILVNGGYISGTTTITSGDLDTDFPVLLHYTGTGGVVRMYARGGVQQGADVSAAYAMYPTHAMRIGGWHTQPFTSGSLSMVVGGNASLTEAEIASVFTQHAAGQVPFVPSKTARQFVFASDVADAKGGLPTRTLDRAGSGDALARVGSALAVAQRTERLWSYETTPILYGAGGFTVANYFAHPSALRGVGTGFYVSLLVKFSAVGAGTRVFASTATSNSGWLWYTSGTNSTLVFQVHDATNAAKTSPTGIIAAAEQEKLFHLVGVHDGGAVRLYLRRAQQGATGAAITGYAPSAEPLTLGRDPRAGTPYPADGVTIYGMSGGHFVPTLAEIQAQYDACMALEDMAPIPGKTTWLYSVKRDAPGLSQLTDRIGTDHLTKNGSPSLVPQYARAWV